MRRPTILDVNPDTDAREWEREFLERLEAHVVSCPGPSERAPCPLLHNRACPKVDAADGVLFQLDLDDADHRNILRAYVDRLDVPIRVTVKPGQEDRYRDLLGEVEVTTATPGPALLDGFEAEVESELE